MAVPDRIDIACAERIARALPAPPATGDVVVSVDFDFFVRLPTADDLPETVRDRAIAALDWTGDERVDAATADAQWRQRARDLTALGLDPGRVIGLDPRTGPLDARDALAERFHLPAICQAADSHAWGLVTLLHAARAGGPVHLVSLDAHHDLGYLNDDADTPGRSRARRRTSVCADDWIATALSRNIIDRVTIVYPDWLGDFEWRSEPPTLGRAALDRVETTTWSRWLACGGAPKTARALLAVRSSEWVPPWGGHDQAFLDLVAALAPDVLWLDDIDPAVCIGAHRARERRPAVG